MAQNEYTDLDLSMDHLKAPQGHQVPIEELKKAPQTPEDDKMERMKEREYTFQFEFKSKTGVLYKGLFKNKILSIGERLSQAALQAKLLEGAPYQSVHPTWLEIAEAISYMSYSLVTREFLSPVDWANKDLRELDDPSIVLALFEEVQAHHVTFLGLGDNPEQGTEGSNDTRGSA